MANAMRDNFERAQFMGYDPRMVRFMQFALSRLLRRASVAACTRSPMRSSPTTQWRRALSANVLLMTYIGGATFFCGPIIGAVLITLLQAPQPAVERLADLRRACSSSSW